MSKDILVAGSFLCNLSNVQLNFDNRINLDIVDTKYSRIMPQKLKKW